MNDGARTRTPVKALGSQPSMATISSHPPYTESAVEDIIFPADGTDQGIDTGYHFLRRVIPKCCFQLERTKAFRAHCQD